MSNGFDPDQDQHSVGPDLGPNCLQKLSAEDKFADSRVNVTLLTKNNWQTVKARIRLEGAVKPGILLL